MKDGCHKGLWLQLLDNVVDSGVVEHGSEFEALLSDFMSVPNLELTIE